MPPRYPLNDAVYIRYGDSIFACERSLGYLVCRKSGSNRQDISRCDFCHTVIRPALSRFRMSACPVLISDGNPVTVPTANASVCGVVHRSPRAEVDWANAGPYVARVEAERNRVIPGFQPVGDPMGSELCPVVLWVKDSISVDIDSANPCPALPLRALAYCFINEGPKTVNFGLRQFWNWSRITFSHAISFSGRLVEPLRWLHTARLASSLPSWGVA